MKIIVHELKTTLYQTVIPEENTFVEAIRPHIYKHGSPAGALKVQVQDANGYLIAESNTVNIVDLSASAYFHGHITFDINVGLRAGETYRIALVPTIGYSFSESAYIGVCNSYDLSGYTQDYVSSSGNFSAPLDIQIWRRVP